jgi:MoaA/NifB/PqqE/SkfB family radical SAM enzyme
MKQLSIHLTDLCNSKCAFCVVASPLYVSDSVKYAEIVRFLESHAGQDYETVNLHGGEATIHPKFFETLELIKRLGYPEIHVQTNGILIGKTDFARRAVEAGANLFIISLHAAEAAVQDELTHTPGGFEKTLQGIRNVKALGARVRTNTVVTQQNSRDLPRIVQLACDLGVDHINISNFHPVGSSMFSLARTLPRLSDAAGDVKAACAVALAEGRRLTLEGFPFCSVPGLVEYQLNSENRQIKMLMRGQVISNYDGFMTDRMRTLGAPCRTCPYKKECGGVYPEYIQFHGWEEFAPLEPALAGAAA